MGFGFFLTACWLCRYDTACSFPLFNPLLQACQTVNLADSLYENTADGFLG